MLFLSPFKIVKVESYSAHLFSEHNLLSKSRAEIIFFKLGEFRSKDNIHNEASPNSFSAATVFRCQNLTSIDVIILTSKDSPATERIKKI